MAKQSEQQVLHSFGELRSHISSEKRQREIQEGLAHSKRTGSFSDTDAQWESGDTHERLHSSRDESRDVGAEPGDTTESNSPEEIERINWDRPFSINGGGQT